ncbi:hypothetical protein Tco_1398289 [Tanacetum coccineum]
MCQSTSWDAQPHDWDSDEMPADRLEVCAGRLEVLCYASYANFEKKNKHGTIKYHLQQVKNANLKWRELSSAERHAYCERLFKLQGKGFGIPRVPSWTLSYNYNFKETLKNKMKYEYLHDDGDVFVDYSWERALLICGDVFSEWLCGAEKVLNLPEFLVLLGLYEEDELNHRLFAKHFTRLEVDDKLFNHKAFWQKIRQPTKHLCKHALGLKENCLICGGHYVTKIAHSLGYLNNEEVAKCSKQIECETWIARMLENELDEGIHSLIQIEQEAPQPGQARRQSQEPRGFDSSWGDWNGSLNEIERSIVPSSGYKIGGSSAGFHRDEFDLIVHSKDCVESDDDEMRD